MHQPTQRAREKVWVRTLVLRSGHAVHTWSARINAIVMAKAHKIKHSYLASESPYQIDQTLARRRRGARNPVGITGLSTRRKPKKIAARAAYSD
jgi:hypothetical protein